MEVSEANIAVIGLGYVGLPLAVEFAKSRRVVGYDINKERISELQSGQDSTLEVESEELAKATGLVLSSSLSDLQECNVYIVTVPTPIDENNAPDLTPLRKASELISTVIKVGDVVITNQPYTPARQKRYASQ